MSFTNVILSVKPQFAEPIVKGEKRYELRRSVFKRKDVDQVYVYSTSPVSRIIGSFEIEDITEDSPEGVWRICREHAVISESDFFRYFEGAKTAFAIKIARTTRFSSPLDPFAIIKDFRPPQSFRYISSNLCGVKDRPTAKPASRENVSSLGAAGKSHRR